MAISHYLGSIAVCRGSFLYIIMLCEADPSESQA